MEYAGSYRLEVCLGSGGMGEVHLARSASGLRIAVKVVHQQYAADPEFRARFRQEVAAARRVSGAFTAPVVDADPDAERPWMATSYIPGPTLAEQVKSNGPMSPAELRRLTAGLAEALRDIHRAGVVHRDLKPGNVLLTDNGPKVIDFGISRPVDSDLRTETGKLIGSPPFMAPEQFQRPREVGPAADVFALGSLLVHAATGRGPFDSDSPYIVAYQVVHDEADLVGLPDDLTPLVGRCLAKDPRKRPTPDEIMRELRPPSYEAAAFIPAQRRLERRPSEQLTHAGDRLPDASAPKASRASKASNASKASKARTAREARNGSAPAPALAPHRRFKWPALAVGTVVLVYGGLWAVTGFGATQAAPPAPKTSGPPATAFEPWTAPAIGKGTNGAPAPACSYAPGEPGTSSASAGTAAGVGDGTANARAAGASKAPAALFCSTRGVGAALLDPADGRLLWSHGSLGGEPAAAPVLSGGLAHTVLTTEGGGRLRTYEPGDGTPAWSVDLSAYPGGVRHAGDTVLLVAAGGRMKALNSATGKVRWEHRIPGHTEPRLGFYSPKTQRVYAFEVADDGRTTLVSAVDPLTGEPAWQHRLDGWLSPVAIEGEALFLTSKNLNSQTDGIVRHDPVGKDTRLVRLPFAVSEPQVVVRQDTAYVLARGGTLLAVDTARTGKPGASRWQLETDVARSSRPVVTPGGRLYFSAADGRLITVDTARGALIGATKPRLVSGKLGYEAALPAPVTAPGRVFAGAPDGSVFAVDSRDPATW